MHAAVRGQGYCDACFTGDYPIAFEDGSTPRRRLGVINH
jgi:hypothetical protein